MSLWRALTMTFPLAPHGDWSRRGLLSSSTMTLIWHLNSSHSHPVIHTILGQRQLHISLCLELSNQGPPGDYMSLSLYHCRCEIILVWDNRVHKNLSDNGFRVELIYTGTGLLFS